MFNRRAIEDIKAWHKQIKRKPLVIRGARQVGKTTAVRLAADQLSVKVIEVNLERHTAAFPKSGRSCQKGKTGFFIQKKYANTVDSHCMLKNQKDSSLTGGDAVKRLL
ncbi:MAG: AAA family ATPase [Desulfatirhabdiaceae bacterium]